MNNEVNLEYELNINDILTKMINWHPKENLTLSLTIWNKEIAKTSSNIVLEVLDKKRFDEYNDINRQDLIKLERVSKFIHHSKKFNNKEALLKLVKVDLTDEVNKKIDEIISSNKAYQYYTYVDNGANLIFTKNDLQENNFIKIDFTESKLDYYSELFLAKINIVEDLKVFDFLDYQLEINFENNTQKFIEFLTLLKHFAKRNEYLFFYEKSEEKVNDWINRIDKALLTESDKEIESLKREIKILEKENKELKKEAQKWEIYQEMNENIKREENIHLRKKIYILKYIGVIDSLMKYNNIETPTELKNYLIKNNIFIESAINNIQTFEKYCREVTNSKNPQSTYNIFAEKLDNFF